MSDDLHHLAAAYALDALDELERRRFEAHYPTCEICASEVDDFRAVASDLAAAESIEPPSALRARVLGEVARTPQLSPLDASDDAPETRAGTSWSRLGLAAAAGALLLAGLLAISGGLGDDTPTTDELVAAPDAVVTTLDPDGAAGVLQVVWSADQDRVAVVGSGLDGLAPGQAYALWFLLDDGVEPAALFVPDDDGAVAQVLEVDDFDAEGWGISIEPDTGSDAPTTPVIFAGTV